MVKIAAGSVGLAVSQYLTFQDAFQFFNHRLFDGGLPECMITYQRQKTSVGYFMNDSYTDGSKTVHEIALNPELFLKRSDFEILSTLVHEMVHLWQQEHGKPSRNGYHNTQWAKKMIEVGLQPFAVKNPKKMTGQKISHFIVGGGKFEIGAIEFLEHGTLNFFGALPESKAKSKKKRESKTKFTCESCGQNAWAKPSAHLVCGDCDNTMVALPSDSETE